jgi:hypothetical protein
MKLIFSFLLAFLLISSCSSSNQLQKFEDNNDCITTIEGNFKTPEVYKYLCPAVLFHKENKIGIKYGDILDVNNDGVLILERKSGLFDDRDTLFYKYDLIRAIVNEEGFCIWGNLEEKEKTDLKLNFFLRNSDSLASDISSVQLVSNEKFSFCTSPGNYEILRIEQYLGDEDFISIPDSLMRFTVAPERANYIGNINLVSINRINDKTIRIPFKKKIRANNIYFGNTGNMHTTSGTYEIDSAGYFNLNVIYDENFETISNGEKVISKISFFKF